MDRNPISRFPRGDKPDRCVGKSMAQRSSAMGAAGSEGRSRKQIAVACACALFLVLAVCLRIIPGGGAELAQEALDYRPPPYPHPPGHGMGAPARKSGIRKSGLDYRPPPPVPHPPGWGSTDLPARAAPPQAAAARELAHNRLRSQQQQALREEERDWGERIQALAGKPPHQPSAARLQALSQVGAPASVDFFAALTAAGARTESLAGAGPADDFGSRIGKVERKYQELVKEQRADTKLKEEKVTEIFESEMAKLAAKGHSDDERLRKDEENAETTIIAEKKEREIRKQLAAVQAAAVAKAKRLEDKLNAAHQLALKYKEVIGQDTPLPQEEKADAAGLTAGAATLNSTKVLGKLFTRKLDQITLEAAKEAEGVKQAKKKSAAEAEAAARARKAAEDRKAKAKREEEQKAAAKAIRLKEQAAAAQKKAELLKKEQARKVRCTEDHCPLETMDNVMVVNGDSIHHMEKEAEDGHGVAKSQALAMIEKLREKIRSDFSQVTGFATHQEHILDVKKVSKDTAFMLGQEVALSLDRGTDQAFKPGENL